MAWRSWARSVVVSFAAFNAAPAGTVAFAQPANHPGTFQPNVFSNLQTVRSFEVACSQSMIDSDTDARCRLAISMALGKEPIVEEVRRPDGTRSLTGKILPPDAGKAGWLGEEACANRHWQSCMLYAMLLERGDAVPRDPPHAVALYRVACADGYSLACEALERKGVPPVAGAKMPPRPSWVKEPPDEPAPRVTVTVRESTPPPPSPVAPQRTPALTEPLNPGDPTEAEPLARCIAGSARDCDTVARIYDTTGGGDVESPRAVYYYQKACYGGIQHACDRIHVPMPEQTRRAVAAGRTSTNLVMWLVAAGIVAGIAVVAIAVYRKLGGSPASAPASRPVAVRPPAGAKRPGA